jgi:hypothetical protein
LVYTGTLDLTGTIVVSGGNGELDVGTLTGPGALDVGADSTFVLADGEGGDSSTVVTGAAPTIGFIGNGGTLVAKDASLLGTLEITSFLQGDVVALPNLGFADAVVAKPGTVDLLSSGGSVVGEVLYGGSVSGTALAAAIIGQNHGVTQIG